jgi:phage baseplate assembly protein W
MAFGAKKIFPIDTKPGTAVGVSIPFNAPAVFFSTYTTKDAIRNNLINFLLTNQKERYLNSGFGANIRAYIFEQITLNNTESLKDNIQNLINIYFPIIKLDTLDILGNPDYNELTIRFTYTILNTDLTDQAQITFIQ